MKSLFNKHKATSADNIAGSLEAALGENLLSLIQYGSSIRGEETRQSDINLLLILKESTPEAHQAIHEIIRPFDNIEPFVAGELNGADDV